MDAPRRHPITDPKTGTITPEWLSWLTSVGDGGGVTAFTNVSVTRSVTGVASLAVSLDANTLTGDTLAPNVIHSSLTSVGTLTSGALGAGFSVNLGTVALSGAIQWANLPSGAGTWTAAPYITGNVTIGSDILPLFSYTSNLGSINNKLLAIYGAELWVETLVAADTMATIGGRVLVIPTTELTADLSAAATSIQVKHNNLLNGSRIRLESNGQVEWMAVTSGASGIAGAYVYTVTRDLDGSGANAWPAGSAVVNTGTTGDGFIDLYALTGVLSGVGPTIVGNVRTGTTYNQIEPRWAIGNLKNLYGYVVDTFGVALGVPTGAWTKLDSVNGLRFGFDTDTTIQIDASGLATFQNGIVIEPGGSITAGGVIIDDLGIYITPCNDGGTGPYEFEKSVRWTNDLDYRTAIWECHNTTDAFRQWNFDHIVAGVDATFVFKDSTTQLFAPLSITDFGRVRERHRANAGTSAEYELAAGTETTADHGVFWMFAHGLGTGEARLGVGTPGFSGFSGIGPTLTSGMTVSGGAVTFTSPSGVFVSGTVGVRIMSNGAPYAVINAAGSGYVSAITVDNTDQVSIFTNSKKLRFVGGVVSGAATGAYLGYLEVSVDGLGNGKLAIYS